MSKSRKQAMLRAGARAPAHIRDIASWKPTLNPRAFNKANKPAGDRNRDIEADIQAYRERSDD